MSRVALVAGVVLLVGTSARGETEIPDDGVMVLRPSRQPVAVNVPDGGIVIIGGLPPIPTNPAR